VIARASASAVIGRHAHFESGPIADDGDAEPRDRAERAVGRLLPPSPDRREPDHGVTLDSEGDIGVLDRFRRLVRGRAEPPAPPVAVPGPPSSPPLTIFHVTHWKAGSQWINKIVNRCVGDRVLFAEDHEAQFLQKPLLAGKVYTTCYLTRDQFYSVSLPEPWCRFVVIRDLRDTLVSFYYSIRFSHADRDRMPQFRDRLEGRDREDSLLSILHDHVPPCAEIQRSWLDNGEELIKYEDLLDRDVEILEPLFTGRCPLGVPAEQVREAVLACRFERLTAGRPRGEENVLAHERKGIAGDWRSHFTPRIRREFKARFGDLLVATGYERDLDW
jgi:lipopolysaccharide transport system ATP-binding protein